jgi:hypothetical protein
MAGLQNGANQDQTHNWSEPWWNLLKLVNIIVRDAVGVLFFGGVVRAVEYGIGLVSPEPIAWTMNGVSVSLSQIAHYFELVVFVVFLLVALVDVGKWALRR